jgi:hypothetical protein
MLKRLNRLHRRDRNMRELRTLDCRLLEDIGLAPCQPSIQDTNALMLHHRGPFDR